MSCAGIMMLFRVRKSVPEDARLWCTYTAPIHNMVYISIQYFFYHIVIIFDISYHNMVKKYCILICQYLGAVTVPLAVLNI